MQLQQQLQQCQFLESLIQIRAKINKNLLTGRGV